MEASSGQHFMQPPFATRARARLSRRASPLRRWLLPCLLAALPALAGATEKLPEAVAAQIDQGDFAGAEKRIAAALQGPGPDAPTRQALQFQRERMRRIRLDFSLDQDGVLARLRKQIPDLQADEVARWSDAGLLEHLRIDGELRYFNRAPSNLFLLNPQAAIRRSEPLGVGRYPYEHLHPHHLEIVEQADRSGQVYVAPRRLRVTQTLSVDADAVPAGETLRAWIPYPRQIPGQQQDIRLVGSRPAGAQLAPASALQRTAYLEAKAQAGQPTRFSVSYEITVHAQDHRIDPDRVVRAPITPALAEYVAERPPHVVFTPALREFSRRIVGEESNPYRIAQKLFAAVDQLPWAGAREYSTLANISDYALHAGHADCGQQTLLLIALLRLNGIPARWQSGWIFSDDKVGFDNIHDWGFVYLAPYGWVPMDVTSGQLQSEDPALRWFYLGGLDAYRIAFNDDWSRDFAPAKRYFRSDTVDSQRGEVEWRGGNLYYDQWDYGFEWKMLPLDDGEH